MEDQNNTSLLTREDAWWFIPEEYCPIFLKLEKEFNDQINIRRKISEIENKIKNIRKSMIPKKVSEQLNKLKKNAYFSREMLEDFVESLREERYYHYSDLADHYERNDNSYKKFVSYANVMGNKDLTGEIVDHFIKYFTNLGILKNDNGEYYFGVYSNYIANYKVRFVTAQIILECITSDLQTNQASRMMIFNSMHSLNQNPLVEIRIKEGDSRKKALNEVYRKSLDEGLKILINNGLVTEPNDKQYVLVYKQEDELQQDDNIEVLRERNKDRKLAALRKLAEINAHFHQTTNTSEEKKKNKLRRAQSEIDEKLSRIDQSSKDGRITYHWFNVILQCRNFLDSRKFKIFADDVITYIRYQNIKHAITPVDKDSLYEWESEYPIWNEISKLIQQEANLRIISWPISISDVDYKKAVSDILTVINNLIGNDFIEKISLKNDTNENAIEQIRARNEQLLSLFFVRADIEPLSSNELSSHLEQLFNVIASDEDKNHFDLSIIIRRLNILAVNNTFDYVAKTKSWIYALKNISEGSDSFIVQTTLIFIYNLLIGLSSDEASREKYQRTCRSLFSELKPHNYNQEDEVIWLQLEYLKWSKDSIPYQEMAQLLSDLWKNIGALFAIADKNDPRPYIYKYHTLELAIRILESYFDFGYSSSFLLSKAYLQLIDLKINDGFSYYILLNQLGNLIKKINPEMAVRIALTNESTGFANWSHYQTIADDLLELNDYNRALEYVCKAEESYNKCNLGDIQGQTFYLESLLIKAEILFNLGKESEAKSLCSNCEKKLKELEELYPQDIRPSGLQSTAYRLNSIMSSLESLPYIYRWMRLLKVLMAIVDMESVSSEIEDFFNKWHGFNGLDLDEDESNPKELVDEFKSDIFPLTMQTVSQNVVFKSCDVDTTPITEYDIKQLNKELLNLYKTNQRSFLCNEMKAEAPNQFHLESEIKIPSEDMLFELLQPECSAKAFVHQMKMGNNQATSDKVFHFEDFEKYHYIVMSEWASKEDRINASNLFLSKFDPSTKSVSKREMAAEVLCQMSSLVDFSDWDKQEKLLNQAESYIVNKDGSIISDRFKEIYLRIMHRLYDVYDYQGRSGLQESSMVEHALELIKSNNIRTMDAAWFLGERAEYRLYINKDRQQAKSYFDKAISILKEIIPATEDSLHYLDIYQKEVVNL